MNHSPNKQLVRAGHEASKTADPVMAKLLSDLATALDVQSARSDALAAENVVIIDLARTFAYRADEYKSSMFGYSVSESVDELNNAGSKELTDAEPPATAAWVNEQRAVGVDDAINVILTMMERFAPAHHAISMLRAHAAQLRGGQV